MMQHDLRDALAQAVASFSCIEDLVLVLRLVQDIFPDNLSQNWERQAYWLIDQCRSSLMCELDVSKVPLERALDLMGRFSAADCPIQTNDACPLVRLDLTEGESDEC